MEIVEKGGGRREEGWGKARHEFNCSRDSNSVANEEVSTNGLEIHSPWGQRLDRVDLLL